MPNFYTVLAYMPSGADYCRGCLMSSWDGSLEELYTENREEIIKFISQYLLENKLSQNQSDTGTYGITLLINGRREEDYEAENSIYFEIMSEARQQTDKLHSEYKEAQTKKKVEQERQAIAAQRRQDQAELARLTKKLQEAV
jgi:hypothetical protein